MSNLKQTPSNRLKLKYSYQEVASSGCGHGGADREGNAGQRSGIFHSCILTASAALLYPLLRYAQPPYQTFAVLHH